MKFRKSKKYKILFMIFVLVVLVGIMFLGDDAMASEKVSVNYNSAMTNICVNRSTGAYVSSYNGNKTNACGSSVTIDIKMIGDDYAHCVNWALELKERTAYAKDTGWSTSSKNAIMVGYLIEHIGSQNFGSFEKGYIKTGAALNTFFADYVSNYSSGSYDYSSNSEINGYISKAKDYYNSLKLTNNLPAVSFSGDNGVLSYDATNKKYFSGKVTANGLVTSYGGDATSYTITATATNGAVVNICTNSNGTNCKTSINIPNNVTSYSFYLFVDSDKITSNDTIAVKVKGSNKSIYNTSVLYRNTVYSDSQRVVVGDKIEYNRTVNGSVTFTVPTLNSHRIYAYKVDENGEYLNGATLEIYKDDPTKSSNLLDSNNGNGYSVTYTTDKVLEGEDDFFNHDYYLVEKSVPDGYVIKKTNKFYLKGSATDDGLTCYGENNVVDDEYCYPENYEYKCQNPDTNEIVDLKDGNCEFEVPSQSEGDNGTDESDSSSDNNTSEEVMPFEEETTTEDDDNTSEEENIPEIVTYPKVCYNKINNKVVEDSFCNNKGNYTSVYTANDNITVRQSNSKNVVRISKKNVTGDLEISGASLKICSKPEYDNYKENCTAARTIDNLEMSWISGDEAHSIYGVPLGSYYIIEVTPPRGYLKTTIVTEFSIDETGKVTTGDKVISNKEFIEKTGAIIIKNDLTKISISKTDMATSKELPGATISICNTYLDENNERQIVVDQFTGDCIEAILADGTKATWVSSEEAKVIEGLSIGTYYLVERKAPEGYTTAESILFTLKDDGSLVDANGKSLADNKLIMYDKLIEEVKTGSLNVYIVVGIMAAFGILGVAIYYFYKNYNK